MTRYVGWTQWPQLETSSRMRSEPEVQSGEQAVILSPGLKVNWEDEACWGWSCMAEVPRYPTQYRVHVPIFSLFLSRAVTSVIETPGNRTAHEKNILYRGQTRMSADQEQDCQNWKHCQRLTRLRMEPRKLRTKNAVIEIETFHFHPESQLTKVPNREKVAE